ncbi:MAG: CdaR family protein [Clostridium sp.]|nr:CdaR family protein [Clostridium sp.]
MDKSKNGNLMVKIICVLLSLGLWLYITNVENPSRSYDVKSIPVELVNTDVIENSKFAIVPGQKFTVDLRVEGPSSEISKIRPEDFKIIADMSNYALKPGQNTIPVQIMSYPENITIRNSGFLGIKVELEEFETKELTIKSDIKLSYKNGIHESDRKISPATVKITGGKSAVDKVDSAVISGEEKDIGKNIENSYKIKFIDDDGNEVSGIESDVSSAKLSITVTAGKKVAVNLKTTGKIADGYELGGYDIEPKYVEIIGDGSEDMESIDTKELDLSSFTQDTEASVNLNLPEGITVMSGSDTIKVKLSIKKLELATKTVACIVKYNNLDENMTIEPSTEKVNVTLSGLQTELDKISDKNIDVSVDLSSVKEEGTYNYKPDSVINDSNVNVTISTVDSVSVVIKKKA